MGEHLEHLDKVKRPEFFSNDENHKNIVLQLGLDEGASDEEISKLYNWYKSLSDQDRQMITSTEITIAEARRRLDKIFEKSTGLSTVTTFNSAIEKSIHHEFIEIDKQTIKLFLLENSIDIAIESCPKYLTDYINKFKQKDLQFISKSKNKLMALYTLVNYYRKIENIKSKNTDISEQIYIRSLPLIHGTSFKSLEGLMQNQHLLNNRELYELKGEHAQEFSENYGQTFSEDREMGLDNFVFAHFGRPDSRHEQQEITLVLDPELLEQEGSFMTEMDYLDYFNYEKPLDNYVADISQAPYFYETAVARIKTSCVGEIKIDGRYRVKTNTIYGFAEGVDEYMPAGIPFSTWEVKLPKVGLASVKKIIFRNKEQFELFKQSFGDKIECVYEPNLRDAGYQNNLKISGEYEKQYRKFVNADYEERVKRLDAMSDDQKEKRFIVLSRGDLISIESDPMLVLATQKGKVESVGYKNYQEIINRIDCAEDKEMEKHFKLKPFYYNIIMRPGDICFIAEIEIAKNIATNTSPKDLPSRILNIQHIAYDKIRDSFL